MFKDSCRDKILSLHHADKNLHSITFMAEL
jgi:hypothetical protein